MTISFRVVLSLALLSAGSLLWADPDLAAMLTRIDTLSNLPTDFTGVYTAVMERAGEKPTVIGAQMYRRDREGTFIILIIAPQAQKGQGYLEIDNNLWFYDPQSRLFSHSSLRENWQSSDAMNSDFYRTNFARDYSVDAWEEGALGSYAVYVLALKGKTNEVTYPSKKIWVRKDLGIVLKSQDYSLSGVLMRTAYYPTYARVGDQYVPSKMLFVDELNKGNRTQMTLTEPSVAPLPASMFTKSYLERVNR